MESATTGEMMGRPQQAHQGGEIFSKDARQRSQTGTRLAVSSTCAQIRQGAGKTTETSASVAVRNAFQTEAPEARASGTMASSVAPRVLIKQLIIREGIT
jgi:hypothetical protein